MFHCLVYYLFQPLDDLLWQKLTSNFVKVYYFPMKVITKYSKQQHLKLIVFYILKNSLKVNFFFFYFNYSLIHFVVTWVTNNV